MKPAQNPGTKVKSLSLTLLIAAALVFNSCNQKGSTTTTTTTTISDTSAASPAGRIGIHPFVVTNLTTTVKEAWNSGAPTTHANDSVFYKSGGNSYKAYTDAAGTAALKDTNYTAGNAIVMEACANHEICGKVFNQAFTKSDNDPNYNSPSFTITALATGDSIPMRILVTDLSGNAYAGYSVQITSGGVNYGTATTTNASGVTTYSRQLAQGQTYVVTATGAAGNASATVSTSPMSGSAGNFSGMAIYIRF